MVYLNFIDIKLISIFVITDIFKYVIDLNVLDILNVDFIYYTQIFPNIYHKDSIKPFNIVHK